MVPRQKEDASDRGSSGSPQPAEDDSSSISSISEPINGDVGDQANMEPEYHTEESDEDFDGEEYDSGHDIPDTAVPLLPKELLKPLPSPSYSLQPAINIPREQMTRQQKVTQRIRDRKAKKRIWDKLVKDAEGSGVLDAGRLAQLKRGIAPRKEKVKSGRVSKQRDVKPVVSGRQQLLEQRKRAVEQSKSQLLRPQGKPRTRRTRVKAG